MAPRPLSISKWTAWPRVDVMTDNQKELHRTVVLAVIKQLDKGLTPKELLNYFETSYLDLRVVMLFDPSLDDFKRHFKNEFN